MIAGTVKAIYRYPVKSMMGESLQQSMLTEDGVLGDRCWAVRDEASGGISGGKKFPLLMQCSASFDSEPSAENRSAPATITLPDGVIVSTADADISQKISSAVGSDVSLWPIVSKDQLDHYRRKGGLGGEDDLRALFARTPDEPLPNLAAFPKELMEFESPPGTYFDAFPLLIMTEAALRMVQEAAADSKVDLRRFRPNIVIDTGDDGAGHVEAGWVGKSMRIGETMLHGEMTCPRCVMVTHEFADLPKDPGIMRAVVQQTGGDLGINASVAEAGVISVGDQLIID